VLLFDWWVCNPDRTLSPDGGNPNLLWIARDHKAFVIDHNLALEPEGMTGFWSEHIFREAVSEWNATFRHEVISIFRRAICDLPGLWKELPTEWTEAGDSVTLESVKTLLSRFESEPSMFWRGQ
jgi:hypothetical protein